MELINFEEMMCFNFGNINLNDDSNIIDLMQACKSCDNCDNCFCYACKE